MPIPDYQSLLLPVLRMTADGREHRFRDMIEALANQLQLTDEERNTLLPSGTTPVFGNRVGWARTYLKQAGLLETNLQRHPSRSRPGTSDGATGSSQIPLTRQH
ncbi:winged helix-turn-helix domain-containing protein [Paraburkholderia sp. J41]|uniref:winged helix-turn-helix domain-containing protein n=1 Tax=Paraburkholderia sp. J41 TaxID=2805433 RepID=UPI002AC3689A|nr:winged helix-turn-helix domain-containing protein [Paraburkholderia sp. J41]